MLADEIVDQVLPSAAGQAVTDIRIGLGYTAVLLADGRCGLAYTLHEQEYESCCVIPEAGKLTGRKASDLIPWMKLDDNTACAIGLAAVNAILSPPDTAVESDILDLLPVQSDDSVGMIGFFGPLVKPLRKRVKAIEVKMLKPDYKCPQCRTKAVKRVFNGVWRCKKCGATFSGGAYFPQTDEGKKSLRNVSRIREKMV